MAERLKIHWVTKEHNLVANAFGYNVNNRAMKRWCSKIMDLDDNAQIALTMTPADKFKPLPGKTNILYTMWEFLDLPKTYIEALNYKELAAIVVPCRFCKDLFQRYTNKPVYVCWNGVEPGTLNFVQREFPKRPNKFRFLWVGAPNPRKGYPLVLETIKLFEHCPDVEIYIKTTVPKINWLQTLKNTWVYRKEIFNSEQGKVAFWRMLQRLPRPQLDGKVKHFGKHKNIVFDTRKLSFQELIELYGSAHCFLLPTFGEGWGLTLCEAMATGCPSIATPVTGVADFFNEDVGFPIDYTIEKQELRNYNLTTRGYTPNIKSFINKMLIVINNYKEALRRGERASRKINEQFTWEQSAWRLNNILKNIQLV